MRLTPIRLVWWLVFLAARILAEEVALPVEDAVVEDRDLERRAREGDAIAEHALAQGLEWGWAGFAQDRGRALDHYRLAAERGDVAARVDFALRLLIGQGTSRDRYAAEVWLKRAVVEKDAGPNERDGRTERARSVANYLAGLIQQGRGRLLAAHELFEASWAAGFAPAGEQCAFDLSFGLGTSRDLERAEQVWQSSLAVDLAGRELMVVDRRLEGSDGARANEELARALQLVIEEQRTRWGEPRVTCDFDEGKAGRGREGVDGRGWVERAAEDGQRWAMVQMGLLEASGSAGEGDVAKAVAWWARAAPHPLAVANQLIARTRVVGGMQDPVAAAEILRAWPRASIVCRMVELGVCPEQWADSAEAARLEIYWSEARGDAVAQFIRGQTAEEGLALKRDATNGVWWWEQAAKQGNVEAMLALAKSYSRWWDKALVDPPPLKPDDKYIGYLRLAAERGDVGAQLEVGAAYLKGIGGDSSWSEAIEAYEQVLAAHPDHPEALEQLSRIYFRRFQQALRLEEFSRARSFRAKALELAERAVRLGRPGAAAVVGLVCLDEQAGEADVARARAYLQKAVAAGENTALYPLADLLERGEGGPVELKEALLHYRLAVANGSVGALARIFALHRRGELEMGNLDWEYGLARELMKPMSAELMVLLVDFSMDRKDYGFAVKLLKLLEETDDPKQVFYARARLSDCYRHGWGVRRSDRLADSLLKQARDTGEEDAGLREGQRLIKAGDPEKGVEVIEQAAEISASACYALGQMYFFGQFVRSDRTLAVGYLRRAAGDHHRDALFFLAVMRLKEEEGAPSLAEAIAMVREAERGGHPQAAVVRRRLEARATVDAGKS